MTNLVLYTIIAFLIVVLAALLVRQERPGTAEVESDRDGALDLSDERFLRLAERIFDPSDFIWLRDELVFPQLAAAMAHYRRQLALRWLRALRRSVKELARVPESTADRHSSPGWHLLWLTLRFHLLLGYALLVVRLAGPYHRLVPSLHWSPLLRPEPAPRKGVTAP